jgi:tetratricopeptide (TPR) repeat protein
MNKSAKVSCAVGAGALVTIATVAGFAWGAYYLVSLRQGSHLCRAGYDDVLYDRHDAAIAHFSAALSKKLDRNNRFYTYLNRGAPYNVQRRFDEGVADLSKAIRLNPDVAASYEQHGWTYQQKGENKKALRDLSEAIKRDPRSTTL